MKIVQTKSIYFHPNQKTFKNQTAIRQKYNQDNLKQQITKNKQNTINGKK